MARDTQNDLEWEAYLEQGADLADLSVSQLQSVLQYLQDHYNQLAYLTERYKHFLELLRRILDHVEFQQDYAYSESDDCESTDSDTDAYDASSECALPGLLCAALQSLDYDSESSRSASVTDDDVGQHATCTMRLVTHQTEENVNAGEAGQLPEPTSCQHQQPSSCSEGPSQELELQSLSSHQHLPEPPLPLMMPMAPKPASPKMSTELPLALLSVDAMPTTSSSSGVHPTVSIMASIPEVSPIPASGIEVDLVIDSCGDLGTRLGTIGDLKVQIRLHAMHFFIDPGGLLRQSMMVPVRMHDTMGRHRRHTHGPLAWGLPQLQVRGIMLLSLQCMMGCMMAYVDAQLRLKSSFKDYKHHPRFKQMGLLSLA